MEEPTSPASDLVWPVEILNDGYHEYRSTSSHLALDPLDILSFRQHTTVAINQMPHPPKCLQPKTGFLDNQIAFTRFSTFRTIRLASTSSVYSAGILDGKTTSAEI